MATNSVIWNGANGQYSRLYIELTLASQDVGNNTSTFAYKVRGQSTTSGASITWASGSLQLSNAYSKTKAIGSGSFNNTAEFVFDSGTFTISHNADGTLSARTLTAYVTLSSGHNATVSASLSVPTIPRASQPTLNVSTQALGSSITISTNRASTSFTHKIRYVFGELNGDIAEDVTDSTAWTLPLSLANAMPNSINSWGSIVCETYNGTTYIGAKVVTFTATVPNNATFQPSATINSIVEGDTLPSGITVFVQNHSKAKVTSSGTGKYSSTIKTYSVSVANIGTYTGSVITSDFLRNSGTVRVTLTVTDSRGLKGSTFQDIEVVEYSPPQLPAFNAIRSETTPEKILATFDASISPISNQNNKLFRIRSKASDGDWVVETTANEMYPFSGTQTIWSDPDKSYTIEFFIQDSFTSITQTVQVGTAFTLINFNDSGKGMAIGKVSESDSLEVAMPSEFISPATIDTYPIWHSGNSNTMTDSGSNANGTYIQFSDGTQICWHIVQMATGVNTANGNIFSTGSEPWVYPVAFTAIPITSVTEAYGAGSCWGSLGNGATQITSTSFMLHRATASASKPTVSLFAIGRWK